MKHECNIKLNWIDGFIKHISPYVYLRKTDNVLICMPNHAIKLNSTGSKLVSSLLEGVPINKILRKYRPDGKQCDQINLFFLSLAKTLSGTLCETLRHETTESVPFSLGYIALPVLSEVAITYKCNLKCAFCYASCHCNSSPDWDTGNELSTENIFTILRRIRHEAEVPSVSFTGGEPLLRPDLENLVSYASKTLGMRVNLISNGTLIDKTRAKRLKRAGLSSAQISIESPHGKNHDRIVGKPDAFKASVNGLKALLSEGIHAHPHSTISRLNQNDVPMMAAFVSTLGINRFSANLVIPAGRGTSENLALFYKDIGDIILKIKEEAAKHRVKFMWYSPTPACLFNPISNHLGNKGCSACEGLLSVGPAGDVLPCSSWLESMGNLLNTPFKEIWFGERAAGIRLKQEAHPQCRECPEFAHCHGACPLYFKIHGYSELEPFLNQPTEVTP